MRVPMVLISSVVVFACGKSEAPDAGAVDSGSVEDAGFVAPLCLVDVEDAGPGTDAGLDFSCRGLPPPPGGQAELVITGKTSRAGFMRTPMSTIRVELLRTDGTVLASATSTDAGLYRLTFDAGCFPLAGEVRATHPSPDAGFALSYSSPGTPWRHDRSNLELVLFDESTRGLAAGIANVTLVDGGAVLAMTVEDCAGNPVEGAVVTTASGAGEVRYVGVSGLPSSTLARTGASGDVVIFNLPGDSVDVSASLDGGVIAQRVVKVHGDAVTGTFLSP